LSAIGSAIESAAYNSTLRLVTLVAAQTLATADGVKVTCRDRLDAQSTPRFGSRSLSVQGCAVL